MTDKTMPERIFAWSANDLPLWCRANVVDRAIEYVRADLAQGDASEPFKQGQYRWVRVREDDGWTIAEIVGNCLSKRLMYFVCGNEVEELVEDCYEWGSVIRPPENM